MALKTSNKKSVKGFTLVEIIVVLVILAILAAATIPSLFGFIDDSKFKIIDNEARVVRNAAQAYATEQSAGGKTDEFIEGKINGVINSNHALHYLLQNDANGTVFMTEVKNGKIKKFNYTKEIVNQDEDVITDKVRYVVFDDEKTSLLHATGSVTTIDAETFKANIIAEVKAALTSNDPESLKSTLTSSLTTDLNSNLESSVASLETSLTTNLNSSLESGMNSRIAALKTNFSVELGSNVVNLVYPVGSYYVSHSPTSPQTLFPGTTWTQIENKCLFCMAAGNNVKKPENSNVALHVGDTGGEATHTLTVNEMPSHNHSTSIVPPDYGSWASSGNSCLKYDWSSAAITNTINKNSSSVGGGQSHNNMPPYIAVYRWRRTA